MLFICDFGNIYYELGIFTRKQARQCVSKILTAAPFAHQIMPGSPLLAFAQRHMFIKRYQIGAFKESNKNSK